MRFLGLASPSAIQSRLKGLQEKGRVTWRVGAARSLRVLDRNRGVPIQGTIQVATGQATFASIPKSIDLHGLCLPPHAFVLRLDGALTCLSEARIAEFCLQDQDYLIFHLPEQSPYRPVMKPMLAIFRDGDHRVLGQIQLANSNTLDIQPIRVGLPVPAGVVQAIAVGLWRNWKST